MGIGRFNMVPTTTLQVRDSFQRPIIMTFLSIILAALGATVIRLDVTNPWVAASIVGFGGVLALSAYIRRSLSLIIMFAYIVLLGIVASFLRLDVTNLEIAILLIIFGGLLGYGSIRFLKRR